jgi:Tol biopolymer transport system component
MQRLRSFGGARLWRGLGALALVGMLALAGCGGGGNTDSAGVNLGSGPLLAFIGGDGNLWLARGDGTEAHAVTTTDCPPTVNCYGPPAWSPDGTLVAVFGPDKATPSQNDIYIYNRQGVLQNTIAPPNPLSFGSILWSADGKTVAFASDTNNPTATKGTSAQYAFIMLNALSGAKSGTITLPSPTGADATCSDTPRGGSFGSLVDRAVNGDVNGFRATLGWSPDGSHILISGGACSTQVQLIDKSGNAQTLNPLTADSKALVLQAAFSPDGQHIIATQTTTAEDDLILYDATGNNGKVIYADTDPPPAFAPRLSSPVWSADGKTIYFMRGADIWSVGADGANAQRLIAGAVSGATLKDEAWPQPSPDGKSLAWEELTLSSADNMPRSALYVGTITGGNPTLVDNGAVWPVWS